MGGRGGKVPLQLLEQRINVLRALDNLLGSRLAGGRGEVDGGGVVRLKIGGEVGR